MHMGRFWGSVLTVLLVGWFSAPLEASVKVAGIFGDNMVLQADRPVKVWGNAAPAERVRVAIDNEAVETTAAADGTWQVTLKAHKAGGPHELTVNGEFKKFSNVMFGDVWLCAGQSNMAFLTKDTKDAKQELADAEFPGIRLCKVANGANELVQKDTATRWQASSAESAAVFSAVGFYFARDVYKKHGRPIGMIDVSVGGACVENFIRREALASTPETDAILQHWDQHRSALPELRREYEAKLTEWKKTLPANVDPNKPDPNKPKAPMDPRDPHTGATAIFNGRVAPLTSFPLRGVLWYQGETDAQRIMDPKVPTDKVGVTKHRRLLTMLIQDWRKLWDQEDLPFFYVQLTNFATGRNVWGTTVIREEQAAVQALPHTAMVVTMDVGGGLHPVNKVPVGQRLARCARALCYGEKDLAYRGPTFKEMKVADGVVTVTFDGAEGGLVAEGAVGGFAVAGEDKVFQKVAGRIEGNTVVLAKDPKVPNVVAVRYGYADDPQPPCNLYNGAGLPAVPFRTDKWELLSVK